MPEPRADRRPLSLRPPAVPSPASAVDGPAPDRAGDAIGEGPTGRLADVARRVARAPGPPPPQPADAPPDGDDALDGYTHAVLDFPGPPRLRLDLRHPMPADVRARLAEVGLDGPFAVLTAENPAGAYPDDAPSLSEARARERINVRRTRTLEAALEAGDADWVPVLGTAPDGSHAERCVAVRVALPEARRLALSAVQEAFFWWDGVRFWVVPAAAGGAPRRLPDPA